MIKNKDFCHEYAYASNDESAKNGNMSYANGIMYSYNTVLAKKLDNCTLYNATKYSVSTSIHQNYLINALSGKIIYIDGLKYSTRLYADEIVEGLTYCYNFSLENLAKSKRTSTKERYAAEIFQHQETLKELLEYKVLNKKDLNSELKELSKGNFDVEKLVKIKEQQQRKEERARLQRLEHQRQDYTAEIADFRAGRISGISYSARDLICGGFDIIRLEDEEILTSQNIRVPLKEALKMFKQAKSCKTANAPLPVDEIPHEKRTVGKFTIDRIGANGDCFVGCHKFQFEEILRCYNEEYKK